MKAFVADDEIQIFKQKLEFWKTLIYLQRELDSSPKLKMFSGEPRILPLLGSNMVSQTFHWESWSRENNKFNERNAKFLL